MDFKTWDIMPHSPIQIEVNSIKDVLAHVQEKLTGLYGAHNDFSVEISFIHGITPDLVCRISLTGTGKYGSRTSELSRIFSPLDPVQYVLKGMCAELDAHFASLSATDETETSNEESNRCPL